MIKMKIKLQGFHSETSSGAKRLVDKEFPEIYNAGGATRGFWLDELQLGATLKTTKDIEDLIFVLNEVKPSFTKPKKEEDKNDN